MTETVQLAFIEKKLDKKAKREVTRILRSYGTLDALIKSMSVEMPKMTVNYEPSEAQRGNQFYSSTEDLVIKAMQLEIKKKQKEKLDIIYESLNQEKRDIWEKRFIEGFTDEQTMIQMNLASNRNKYFGEKYDLMGMIADSFYLW
jgi:ArpU family phage transcriptional regulator